MATGKKRAGAGGRPRSGSTTDPREALEPLHVRVGVDQRARWRASVAECDAAGFDERTESAWVRAGLEAFAEVCAVAVRDQIPPAELAARLLEQHDRVRVLLAQLETDQARRALTAEEDRVFRVVAPAQWERLSFAGALTLAPTGRTHR